MPTLVNRPLKDLEEAKSSLDRVSADIDAVDPNNLSVQNVDLIFGVSVVIGVIPNILAFQELLARLPGSDSRNVTELADRAKALWFLVINNLPRPETAAGLEDQIFPLRTKLLTWAYPIATTGIFSQAAIDKIKEGSGLKDAACDVVALAGLYQSCWDRVENICGVTKEDLELALRIGPAVFAALSLRDNQPTMSPSEIALRIRKAWTLVDRSYEECRRGVAYLRWYEDDVDTLVPSLRRNAGNTSRQAKPQEPAAPATPASPSPSPAVGDTPIGGNSSPFLPKT